MNVSDSHCIHLNKYRLLARSLFLFLLSNIEVNFALYSNLPFKGDNLVFSIFTDIFTYQPSKSLNSSITS